MSDDRNKTVDYRSFIDGLRAVAILAVVGYHIGIPGFSGGFIGVDVFFVISGFLIIGHITDRMGQDRFSLVDFYARRILRLLPLLLTVLLVTCGLAAIILATPAEFRDFGRSVTAAAVMLSNHYFLSSEGYFDTAADTKPLLHTWSLGVEAQFYVAAPLLIWLLTRQSDVRRRRQILAAGAIAISLLSFIACIYFTGAVTNPAFFLMSDRAWEFVAGAAARILAGRIRSSPIVTHLLGLLGLALILGCVVFYSGAMLYPSWYPLLPVLGAACAIAAGEANAATYVRRLLAARPLVGLGLVSYGWYLWHWPLLTFTRIHHVGHRDVVTDVILGGGVSLALAIATYFLIERPVARNKAQTVSRGRIITVGLGLASCLLVTLPGEIYQKIVSPALAERLTPAAWPDKTSLKKAMDPCIMSDSQHLSAACLPSISGKSFGMLLGDSHAREAYTVLHDKAAISGTAFITLVKPSCPPLIGTDVLLSGVPERCPQTWQTGLDSLQKRQAKPDFAILYASWSIYVGGENDDRPIRNLTLPDDGTAAPDQYRRLEQGLNETIRALRDLGIHRILIVAPEPQFRQDGAACLIHARQLGQTEDICARPQAEIEAQHRRTLAALTAVSQADEDLRVIDPFQVICDGTLCRQHAQGIPTYIDDNHLSKAGNDLLFATFAQDLAWVFGRTMAAYNTWQPDKYDIAVDIK